MHRFTYPRTLVRGFQFAALLAVFAFAALLLSGPPQHAEAGNPYQAQADSALVYMKSFQNDDGGFPAFGTDSAPGSTIDAIFALLANGENPRNVTKNGNSPIDYLEGVASGVESDPGAAAKLAFALSASDIDASDFAGLDIFAIMDGFYNDSTGEYGDDTWDLAFYMLAFATDGQTVPATAVTHLQSLQQSDGGWEFGVGFGTDTNTVALMIEGLVAAGVPTSDASIQGALGYLDAAQNTDAGWPYSSPGDSDPSSTGFVIQGLIAADEDLEATGPWVQGGVTPLENLAATQNPTTGAFQYFGDDSLFSTYQAIPAILLAPFTTLPTPEPTFTASPVPTLAPTLAPTASPTQTPTAPAATASPTATPKATLKPSPASLPSTGGSPGDGGVSTMLFLAAFATLLAGAATTAAVRQKR